MTAVTVELEDLEAIVFATGVIRTIEGALASYKRDPFVIPHLNYGPAHDRLAAEMRRARRDGAGTLVGWNDPLDQSEIKALDDLAGADKDMFGGRFGLFFTPDERLENKNIDKLAAKGMVVIGQPMIGVSWGDQTKHFEINPRGFHVKITDRGYKALQAAQKASAQKVLESK